MEEIWKDIPGYEKLYQVSNLGNVKSLSKRIKNGKEDNNYYISKEKILKSCIDSSGYKLVVLRKENKSKSIRIHKLVAEVFINNPNNYKCINHKDENKLNNNVDNLEWCTYQYNNSYGNKGKKISLANTIKVVQYTKDMKKIKVWDSMKKLNEYIGKPRASDNINACCKNKIKSAYGYVWRQVI